MKKLKAILLVLFLAYAIYAVATRAYGINIRPLPGGGADIAP